MQSPSHGARMSRKWTDEEDNESNIPPLLGLESMARMNIYFGTKQGTVSMVPHGKELSIQWPEGTRHVQCEKTPSGHWLMIISDFNADSPVNAESSTESANGATSVFTTG